MGEESALDSLCMYVVYKPARFLDKKTEEVAQEKG